MKHIVLTAVTAATLAVSPMASAPANATETKDIVGVILGIAALGALANRFDDNDRVVARQSHRIFPGNNYPDKGHGGYRPAPQRSSRVLPGECLRVAEGRRNDDRIVFPELCLNNAGVRTHDLPRRCESRVSTRYGKLDIYGARCLADAGWTLPRMATRR